MISDSLTNWLVASNMFYFPFHIWVVILPIDELHHFSRWLKPPTRIFSWVFRSQRNCCVPRPMDCSQRRSCPGSTNQGTNTSWGSFPKMVMSCATINGLVYGTIETGKPFFPWENLQVGEMMIVVNEVGSVATLCIVMWSSHSNINCLRSTKYIINSGTKKNWSNFTVGTVGMNLKSCKTARGNSMRWNGKKEKHCCSLDECVSSPAVLVMWRHLSHGRRKVRKRRRSKRRDEVPQVMGFPQSSP